MIFDVNAYDHNNKYLMSLVQWDVDVFIYIHESNIDSAYPIHFFNENSESAYVVETTYENGRLKAKIPNLLLQQSHPITAYVYVPVDGGSRSIYRVRINVNPRPKPSDYFYADTDDYITVTKALEEITALKKEVALLREVEFELDAEGNLIMNSGDSKDLEVEI